jgi:chromosome segregation ATPase
MQLRDIKSQECEELMTKLNSSSDENAFLSSKVKELEKELLSCNSYIDSLYAELHQQSSPMSSHELQTELDKRESEWLDLEKRYNKTIESLQAELHAQSKKVSMEMYLAIMKESRRYKLDAAEKQLKIDELTAMVGSLRDQIEKQQRSLSSSKPGLKSMSSLHNKIRPRQVSPTYQQNGFAIGDHFAKENLAPVSQSRQDAKVGRMGAVKSTWETRKGLRTT